MVNKKAYPGTISSVILSLLVLILLLLPFYTANHLEKVRNGEDEYEFKEVICFDIDDEDYFNNEKILPPNGICGEGAFKYYYRVRINSVLHIYHSFQTMLLMNFPVISGTVDGYGISSTVFCTFNGHTIEDLIPRWSWCRIYTTLKKDDIIEKDVVRMDIYLNIENCELDFTDVSVILKATIGCEEVGSLLLGEISVSSVGELEITVDDLLEINTWSEEAYLSITFRPVGEDVNLLPGCDVVFDMQFYHIEEFKIITIDWIGIAMAGGGMFMIFCSVLMLPHVTFSGVIGRLVGKRS